MGPPLLFTILLALAAFLSAVWVRGMAVRPVSDRHARSASILPSHGICGYQCTANRITSAVNG